MGYKGDLSLFLALSLCGVMLAKRRRFIVLFTKTQENKALPDIAWMCKIAVPFDRIIYMPHVRVRDNEPFDIALRRFKRSCEKAGVLSEVRRREFYEKPTAVRKRKAAAAVKRHIKKLQRESRRFDRTK